MHNGHEIILIKSLLGKSSISVRIYTHVLGVSENVEKCCKSSLKSDERSDKSLPQRGHKTANHGPGLVLISTISLPEPKITKYFVRAQMTLATEDPCPSV